MTKIEIALLLAMAGILCVAGVRAMAWVLA